MTHADVRLDYAAGFSLLHAAAHLGHTALLHLLLLLSPPATAARVDEGGRSPLYLAAATGQVSAMLLLLDAAPQLAAATATVNHWTPLHVASKYGRLAAVRLLLERTPHSASAASTVGRTPLHLAAEHGQLAVARRLLEAAPETVQVRKPSRCLSSAARGAPHPTLAYRAGGDQLSGASPAQRRPRQPCQPGAPAPRGRPPRLPLSGPHRQAAPALGGLSRLHGCL